jgi:hypothetical protein
MPRYYFDLENASSSFHDDEGFVVADREAIRRTVMRSLGDLARDELRAGRELTILASVRDTRGRNVLRATLSVSTKWLRP